MNLGIYIPTLANHEQLKDISECVNTNIGTNLTDASIFYDNISYNPYKINCGIFNSTDLWNFNGTLITTSLSSTLKSIKIINNLNIFYYYGFENSVDPLSLIYLNKSGIKFIARDSSSGSDLFRKTRVSADFIASSFFDVVKELKK